ncbi:MAG: hypothetical protein K1X64_23405 [Myxococcaceae bacterium]|nr:hypothetical protein [Myxococcaceae bacterium]
MVPTTLKLPDELKERIAPLAQKLGKTPHAWMVAALESEAERAERWEGFVGEAEEAAREIDAGGPVYAMDDVHVYFRSKVAGKKARRPKAVKISRSR